MENMFRVEYMRNGAPGHSDMDGTLVGSFVSDLLNADFEITGVREISLPDLTIRELEELLAEIKAQSDSGSHTLVSDQEVEIMMELENRGVAVMNGESSSDFIKTVEPQLEVLYRKQAEGAEGMYGAWKKETYRQMYFEASGALDALGKLARDLGEADQFLWLSDKVCDRLRGEKEVNA